MRTLRLTLAATVIITLLGGLGGTVAAQPVDADATGTWSSAGELTHERGGFAAVALPDGRVLVVGGASEEGNSPLLAEIWDSATATFSPAGTLAEPRVFHRATALPDGRVLVVGGNSGEGPPTASAVLWDPLTGTFSPTGPLPEDRVLHTATALPDGRVLVVGGTNYEGPLTASAVVWDPLTETFSPTGGLAVERMWHTATALPDGRVLIVGGEHEGETDEDYVQGVALAEVWDPKTDAFSPAGTLAVGRTWHAAAALPDGRVLVVGGIDDGGDFPLLAEVWDPETAMFGPAGMMRTARSQHMQLSAVTLADGHVLVIGGEQYAPAELWDPATATFAMADGPGEHRFTIIGDLATRLPDDRVAFIDGASAHVWTPPAD